MIFKGLKHTVLKNKFDTLLAQTEGCRTVPLHKIQSVGIITLEEISSKIDLQKEVGAMLGVRNVKIYSLRKFSKTDEFHTSTLQKRILIGKGSLHRLVFRFF